MTDALGASVLRHVLQDVKAHGGAFTETHGHLLATLSEADLQLLQSASELVERRTVTKVTAVPSGRVFFRINSLNQFHQHQHSDSFDTSMESSSGPSYYNCFDHYCSCVTFHQTTVMDPSAMCKHMVALLLADASGKCVAMTIQDVDLPKMLGPAAPDQTY
ncbi:hypothetical protein Poli38472_014652 [Pythium oligandrum]|uniref:SWIM-type domain-containing protein n=1 Tax=Pythium oligandrum TaxID=41045 RepID=A0A8K1FLL4_PYTOL|nr:hypothetical protein Poli38472_014652 [Pythium oligandrum]|eukprot:TMW63947.1 hypothetical protein Poli38472_014652 [Pythium oligandrum]